MQVCTAIAARAGVAQWYDKAEPLLLGDRPKSELYAPRREGEPQKTERQHGRRTRLRRLNSRMAA